LNATFFVPVQFTKQPIIDTYTAFINNWKNAKEAIKLASQAKPAFAKFLEVFSSFIAFLGVRRRITLCRTPKPTDKQSPNQIKIKSNWFRYTSHRRHSIAHLFIISKIAVYLPPMTSSIFIFFSHLIACRPTIVCSTSQTMSREHKGKLTLDAILIMPVQRIPRYELLIKVRVRFLELTWLETNLAIDRAGTAEAHERRTSGPSTSVVGSEGNPRVGTQYQQHGKGDGSDRARHSESERD
jgi:hypothetical protein